MDDFSKGGVHKTDGFHSLKAIGFVYSPLWKIIHQKPSVLCTPPFEKSLIKSHRFCVLPPLKNHCFWWALISANTVFLSEFFYIDHASFLHAFLLSFLCSRNLFTLLLWLWLVRLVMIIFLVSTLYCVLRHLHHMLLLFGSLELKSALLTIKIISFLEIKNLKNTHDALYFFLAVRRQGPNSDRPLKMDRVDFQVLKWGCAGSTSSPATFFFFSQLFATAIQRRIRFWTLY